ncbi:hypothetical protein M9H77_20186 [Catharanthus roseus]|uniref:Uncharacterized protein n=1 Tax=Catharanthus roseus TaxID=4058 RepID=A0ACC0AN65_CATRO|nr:hypothetical protein M9H77_20186 [Catharanthus roseus]
MAPPLNRLPKPTVAPNLQNILLLLYRSDMAEAVRLLADIEQDSVYVNPGGLIFDLFLSNFLGGGISSVVQAAKDAPRTSAMIDDGDIKDGNDVVDTNTCELRDKEATYTLKGQRASLHEDDVCSSKRVIANLRTDWNEARIKLRGTHQFQDSLDRNIQEDPAVAAAASV